MRRMDALMKTALADLHGWHQDQQPLVRAVAGPMVNQVGAVLETCVTVVEGLEEQLSKRTRQADDLQVLLDESNGVVERLQATLGNQTEQVNALQAQYDELSTTGQAQLQHVQLTLTSLVEGNAEFRESLTQALSENRELTGKLREALTRIDTYERQLFGQKSERRKKGSGQSKDGRKKDARLEARKKQRDAMSDEEKATRRQDAVDRRQAKLDALLTYTITIPLPDSYDVFSMLDPLETVVYEWKPGEMVRIVVQQESALLVDGVQVTSAPIWGVAAGTFYGPEIHAKVVVDKVLFSTPLRRQERAFKTMGYPMPVSTLCTLFHRSGRIIRDLYEALQCHVSTAEHVQADETPMPVLDEGHARRGWMWVFATCDALLFVHSDSRGKGTPEAVLGKTIGTLVVDGYTAYHSVTGDSRRSRGGCWSHARRGIYDAQDQDPVRTKRWLDLIGELFLVEELAVDAGTFGTAAHADQRRAKSKPAVDTLMAEVDEYIATAVDAASALYKAARYIQNQAGPLTLFLTEPEVPIHNNLSERALRIVALLRKNSLFAGTDDAAQRYAELLSLLATCQMHGVDPYRWLADVLIEAQRTVEGRIAEDLLPWNWKETRAHTAKPLFDLSPEKASSRDP